MGLTWTLVPINCSIKYMSARGYGVLLSSSLLERALPWLSVHCSFHSASIDTTLSLKVTPWALLWAKIKVQSFFRALGKHILVCVARRKVGLGCPTWLWLNTVQWMLIPASKFKPAARQKM